MSDSTGGLDAGEVNVTVQRTPTVLILDTSASMGRKTVSSDGDEKKKIEQLNEGLEYFKEEIMEEEHAKNRVDVAVVTFGETAELHQDFTHIEKWQPPKLSNDGRTPMADAIELGIDAAEAVKSFYSDEGIPYTRPFLWLLTDGEPTFIEEGGQRWNRIQKQLDVGTEKGHFSFFAMGVGGADMDTLNSLVNVTGRPALKIKEGMFKEYFEFLKNSLEMVSQEDDGAPDEVADVDHLKDFVQVDPDE
ncbi:VWA domain-containing protein [Haloarcula sp. Atlit-120R]|uniref:vWA domain-containing protein n=1 Tax=Haloarcula sp. Atlit-120R TaxID=2282135 RepID=UPI000EF24697|nr:VWA domain-containing protein [Haloarcula sp. Atlit-120R]RLM32880.1 VWA domain-containing protein [Haloarcula sp. Atlit-120R]